LCLSPHSITQMRQPLERHRQLIAGSAVSCCERWAFALLDALRPGDLSHCGRARRADVALTRVRPCRIAFLPRTAHAALPRGHCRNLALRAGRRVREGPTSIGPSSLKAMPLDPQGLAPSEFKHHEFSANPLGRFRDPRLSPRWLVFHCPDPGVSGGRPRQGPFGQQRRRRPLECGARAGASRVCRAVTRGLPCCSAHAL